MAKSQIANSRDNTFFWPRRRSQKLPHAFTEQGIYVLATMLKGKLAVQQRAFIMRVFKEMCHHIIQNQQFGI